MDVKSKLTVDGIRVLTTEDHVEVKNGKWYYGNGIVWNLETDISFGTFEGSGVEYANIGDKYKSTEDGYIYECVVAGDPTTAKWLRIYCNISFSDLLSEYYTTYTGTLISGKTYTEKTFPSSGINNSKINDIYINTDTNDVYICKTGGDANTAKWVMKKEYFHSLYSGTLITGTLTTYNIFSTSGIDYAYVGDNYINTETGNLYVCKIEGNASTAKWRYVKTYIKSGKSVYHGTVMTHTSSQSAVIFSGSGITSSAVDDCYINTVTGEIYYCTLAGDASTAKWKRSSSINISLYKGVNINGNSTTGIVFPSSGIEFSYTNDVYYNTDNFSYYYCTLEGDASTAKWGLYKQYTTKTGEIFSGFDATRAENNSTIFSTSKVESFSVNDIWINTATGNYYICITEGDIDNAVFKYKDSFIPYIGQIYFAYEFNNFDDWNSGINSNDFFELPCIDSSKKYYVGDVIIDIGDATGNTINSSGSIYICAGESNGSYLWRLPNQISSDNASIRSGMFLGNGRIFKSTNIKYDWINEIIIYNNNKSSTKEEFLSSYAVVEFQPGGYIINPDTGDLFKSNISLSNNLYTYDFEIIGCMSTNRLLKIDSDLGLETTSKSVVGAINEIAKAYKLSPYPVGAYYISDVATTPDTLFGGAWEAVSTPAIGSYAWKRTE